VFQKEKCNDRQDSEERKDLYVVESTMEVRARQRRRSGRSEGLISGGFLRVEENDDGGRTER